MNEEKEINITEKSIEEEICDQGDQAEQIDSSASEDSIESAGSDELPEQTDSSEAEDSPESIAPPKRRNLRKWIIMWAIIIAIAGAAFAYFYINYLHVSDLVVTQKGTFLCLTWDSKKPHEYIVTAKKGGEETYRGDTVEKSSRIPLTEAGIEYKVSVRPAGWLGWIGINTEKIMTHKVEQKLSVAGGDIRGFAGDNKTFKCIGKTKMTFKANNENIVVSNDKKSKDGKHVYVRFKKAGEAKVTITAKESPLYKKTVLEAPATIYPTKLATPVIKAKNTSEYKSTISWKKIPWAQEYVVNVYDGWSGSYLEAITVKANKPLTATVPRNDVAYMVQAKAKYLGRKIESKPSKTVKIRSASHEASTYTDWYQLGTLDSGNTEVVAELSGPYGTTCPQSFSYTGSGYIVAFANGKGTKSALVEYNLAGEKLRAKQVKMGHANGSTYSPVSKEIYTLKRHGKLRSRECKTFDYNDFSKKRVFTLPKEVAGISYDVSTGKYYLTSGDEIYIADEDFSIEYSITKIIGHKYTQDTGAGNGVALSCAWNGGNDSYIDVYRTEDGGYLGSYAVPIGEVESATVVDKHLVVLINDGPGRQDLIVQTKEEIPIL